MLACEPQHRGDLSAHNRPRLGVTSNVTRNGGGSRGLWLRVTGGPLVKSQVVGIVAMEQGPYKRLVTGSHAHSR